MMDLPEAQEIIRKVVQPRPTVTLPLRSALFRTLSEPVRCDLDQPPFTRSVMDGYAVRACDVAGAPVELVVAGQIAAGDSAEKSLGPGQAMQINTGAPVPAGADAVVRVEDTELISGGSRIAVRRAVETGKFITPQAAYASAGTVVLAKGTVLGPLELAAGAAAGAATVAVYRRPSVSILSTGDELVDVDQVPSGSQIRNSNQCLLEAMVRTAHCEAILLGIAKDDRAVLRSRISEGLKADVLCLTGGVSMGAFDFVPEVLKDCGATFHIKKMGLKPGRPVHFATTEGGTLIFALPGNPASAFVGFELLVRPALAALQGRPGHVPCAVAAALKGQIAATGDRRTFVPAWAQVDDDGGWIVEPLSWGGSGDAMGLATANALAVRPPRAKALHTGDPVQTYLLDLR